MRNLITALVGVLALVGMVFVLKFLNQHGFFNVPKQVVRVSWTALTQKPDVVFYGDSRIFSLRTNCLLSQSQRNLGLSSSTLKDWRLILDYAVLPKVEMIVFWAGVNDFRFDRSLTPEQVVDRQLAVIERLSDHGQRIVVLGQIPIRPESNPINKSLVSLNELLANRVEKSFEYLEVSSIELDSHYRDKLHLNDLGDALICKQLEWTWSAQSG
ncbi:MAG: hypothetical protein JJ934_18975 [Pseudomonadales bacterium]|nr:hypothetical protein [Pseudomonadales bacterium]